MIKMAHRRAVDRVRSVSSDAARDERYAAATADRTVDDVWAVVEQRLDADRVRKGMASLTAIQREALTLAYLGGYSQSQVAQLLKSPARYGQDPDSRRADRAAPRVGVELPFVRADGS